jgi:hypothetical protein
MKRRLRLVVEEVRRMVEVIIQSFEKQALEDS